MISFEEFKKVEMKVGTVKKVSEIPGSKKLLKLEVDLGGETKQAVAGIKGFYEKEELEGNQFVFVTNLRPAKLMGELSEVMILAAEKDGEIVLIKPEKYIQSGARIA